MSGKCSPALALRFAGVFAMSFRGTIATLNSPKIDLPRAGHSACIVFGVKATKVSMALSNAICRCNVLHAPPRNPVHTIRTSRSNIRSRCTYATKAATAEVRCPTQH